MQVKTNACEIEMSGFGRGGGGCSGAPSPKLRTYEVGRRNWGLRKNSSDLIYVPLQGALNRFNWLRTAWCSIC